MCVENISCLIFVHFDEHENFFGYKNFSGCGSWWWFLISVSHNTKFVNTCQLYWFTDNGWKMFDTLKHSFDMFIGQSVALLPELEVTGLFEICMLMFCDLYFPPNSSFCCKSIITGCYKRIMTFSRRHLVARTHSRRRLVVGAFNCGGEFFVLSQVRVLRLSMSHSKFNPDRSTIARGRHCRI